MSSVITLMTDFGLQDGFVGAMKGVILGIAPDTAIIDITHDIPPQDIDEAAFLLRNAYRYFPTGTVHVVVVDPGVGSARQAIIVAAGEYLFVGPDNGVFAYIYRMEANIRVHAITNEDYGLPERSHTFHGRDVFAPVAAHLARGVDPSSCGPSWPDYARGAVSEPVVTPDHVDGHVLHIDRFGNIITDISEKRFAETAAARGFLIHIAGHQIDRVLTSYADAPSGAPLAIIDSAGLLEIAVNGGDAARTLGVSRGDTVTVEVV